MQGSKWDFDFDTAADRDTRDALRPKSSEERADRVGTRIALLVLCIGIFIAVIWFVTKPSFEKCSAIEDVTGRNACYDGLRQELLKPPAKGLDIPKG